MLRRKARRIEVNGIFQCIGIYSAIPATRRRGRTETRNHAVWHEIAVVQPAVVERVQPVIGMQMHVLRLIVLLLLLLEDLQVTLSLLAERNTANDRRGIR